MSFDQISDIIVTEHNKWLDEGGNRCHPSVINNNLRTSITRWMNRMWVAGNKGISPDQDVSEFLKEWDAKQA